ncbi:hypothetical protein [Nocardia aurantia]|uniref:Guanylate cyclase domain-containing protein n=1 Tax=Nocardia aurantia TaxID=2585199 RepID=A0A7K0DTX9_9NOCA|nr:hypothetical protein [Nocardia aurantia]MQY29196.1 hypothetical protein [Nocardia aurantia]
MTETVYRTIVIVDVEGSSTRNNVQLGELRSALYRVLHDSLPSAEVVTPPRDGDRGDGVMLIFTLPVLDVLDGIIGDLFAAVRRYNNDVGPLDWMRVRVAVHEGYVGRDENGPFSDALTATFRMNDARTLKQTLKNAARADGALAVSDTVYQNVIRHGYRATVTPAEYRDALIATTEGSVRIWIRVPGYPNPPIPTDKSKTVVPVDDHTDRPKHARDDVNAYNLIVGDVRARTIIGRDNVGGQV